MTCLRRWLAWATDLDGHRQTLVLGLAVGAAHLAALREGAPRR